MYVCMYNSFVFACFTVLKYKGKFVFRNYEQLNDNECVAENSLHLSRTCKSAAAAIATTVAAFTYIHEYIHIYIGIYIYIHIYIHTHTHTYV
jgi:hypothetical protein